MPSLRAKAKQSESEREHKFIEKGQSSRIGWKSVQLWNHEIKKKKSLSD